MSAQKDELNESATIHNVRLDSHFSITPNYAPEDHNLSFAAKGLLWYIITRDKNWKIHVWQLSKIYTGNKRGNKKDAIQEMLRELREHGYVKYTKSRNSEGKWTHRYDVYPMPIKDFQKMFPQPVQPAMDDPAPVKPAIKRKIELPSIDIKESIESDVHNSNPDTSVEDSIVPASPSAAQSSIPIHKDKKQKIPIDYSDPYFLELLTMEPRYTHYFRAKIVSGWIAKFGAHLVLKTMCYFFHVLDTQKKPILSPEKWMETAFKKEYAKVDETCKTNKALAEKAKKELKLQSLKINKRYCVDTRTGKDFYYTLPVDEFKRCLNNLCENL